MRSKVAHTSGKLKGFPPASAANVGEGKRWHAGVQAALFSCFAFTFAQRARCAAAILARAAAESLRRGFLPRAAAEFLPRVPRAPM
ncbi:MAG TPA: hypothetical protein VLC12_06490 [Terriglobales bacterium]|nr:hypothetical protein [Terriglobales bacterium]